MSLKIHFAKVLCHNLIHIPEVAPKEICSLKLDDGYGSETDSGKEKNI